MASLLDHGKNSPSSDDLFREERPCHTRLSHEVERCRTYASRSIVPVQLPERTQVHHETIAFRCKKKGFLGHGVSAEPVTSVRLARPGLNV